MGRAEGFGHVPIFGRLLSYDLRLLHFDVIAGVTLWGLLVPEMIAKDYVLTGEERFTIAMARQ